MARTTKRTGQTRDGRKGGTSPFGLGVRPLWLLEPETVHLNHAGFGATPAAVLDAADAWRRRIEANPSRLMETELSAALRVAAGRLAHYVGARGEDLVFVDNATTGINAVLRSLVLMPGDEVLTTSHVYRSVRHTLDFVCQRAGARLTFADIPFPVHGAGEVIAAFREAMTPRTRLLVLDHVTSHTAVVMPLEQIVSLAAERNMRVLVDGAHGPGNLKLSLDALGEMGVSWYVGNCHKWLASTKGCGFLWAHPDFQRSMRPTAIGNRFGEGFAEAFEWPGTKDFSPWLSVTAALDFRERMGDAAARNYCHVLARDGAQFLTEAWGTRAGTPPALASAMTAVALPSDAGSDRAAQAVQDALRRDHGIEVKVMAFNGRLWVRFSAYLYTEMDDIARLAEAGRAACLAAA